MRLSEYQKRVIKEEASNSFGEEVAVYLFGSRVDDSKRGGDIDLFLEKFDGYLTQLDCMRFNTALQMRLGEQKIDIISSADPGKLVAEAKRSGVPLWAMPWIIRLEQVLEILGLEDKLLQDVAGRLFVKAEYDEQWLTEVLSDSNLSDRLESFTSKFCRMQDNMVDKFLPLYLQQQGEIAGSAIDNLRKLERIGLIDNAEAWV